MWPLRVDCRFCGVKVGEPCMVSPTRKYQAFHLLRRQDAHKMMTEATTDDS